MKELLTVTEYSKEANISRQAVYKVDKEVDEKDNQITTILSNTIEILTKQLSTKDNQIEQQSYQINQLNERIKELTERIADLTELQRNNQVLMLHDKKPKLLERIFKNKAIIKLKLLCFYCEYNKVPGTRQQSSIALTGEVLIDR